MGTLGTKFRTVEFGLIHYCPGCESLHGIWLHADNELSGGRWQWDGDITAPTFSPSVNIAASSVPIRPGLAADVGRCHYVITKGQISFCGDSTHALSGQVVPLPDLPEWAQ